jgi:hypothetical protein
MEAYIPSLLLLWTRGALVQRMPKRGFRRQPHPHQDRALSAKVTTGGLSAPVFRWKAGCHLLWIDGSWGLLFQAPLLNINVKEPQVTIMVEKWKVIFLLDSGACFSVLPFSPSPWYNDKFIVWGRSGQHLGHYFTWPMACSCHSFLIVPETPVPLLEHDLLS